MKGPLLSERDEKKVEEMLKQENRWNRLRRLKAIWGIQMGKKNVFLSKKLDVSENTIVNRVKEYKKGGLEGLMNPKYSERRKSRLEEIKEEIVEKVETETVDTLGELSNRINEEYKFHPEGTWLGRWCKKNGIFLTRKGS